MKAIESTAMDEPAIRLERVTKAFDGHTVLDEVSFRVPEGTAFCLLGKSGAGKSVTLKLLIGLLQPDAGDVVGHIMYSPARVGGVMGAALGPMAVTPERQRQGIGTRLVETGNDQLAGHRCAFIVVVGHPTFYSRFGFEPASAHRLTCEWDVPDDVFMVRVLDPHTMAAAVGRVHYRPEFALAE